MGSRNAPANDHGPTQRMHSRAAWPPFRPARRTLTFPTTWCVVMNRRILTIYRPTRLQVILHSGEQSGSGASMWFSSLRFARGGTKTLQSSPFCHGKETGIPTPATTTEACVPRGDNPPKTMDSPNGRSRTGFRCVRHRNVSRPRCSPASLGGGRAHPKKGKTGDRPLTVPSSLPDGRTPGDVL